jgi:hypothetical protein
MTRNEFDRAAHLLLKHVLAIREAVQGCEQCKPGKLCQPHTSALLDVEEQLDHLEAIQPTDNTLN